MDFDGTDDYITAASSTSSVNITGPLTVSAWIKPGTSGGNQYIVGKWNGATLLNYLLMVNAGGTTATFFVGDGNGPNGASATVSPGVWSHIVGMWDGTNTKIYLNGVFVANATTPLAPDASGTSLFFGQGSGNGVGLYNGDLDEVRIYNRALSADEVGQLYRLTTPTGTDTSLKGYWSFNGQDISSATAFDRSGAGNTGTISGASKSIGRVGQALSFDGTDDSISVTDSSSLNQTSAITLSAWIKTTASGRRDIINRQVGSGTYNGYNLVLGDDYYGCTGGSTGKLGFFMGTTGGLTLCSKTSVNDGNWRFTVATYDGTTARLYVDGVLDNSTAMGNGLSGGTTLYIGRSNAGGFFNGLLDEVRIYGRTLSASEIQSLYNQGK